MRAASFASIRAWASQGAQEPEREWTEVSDAGFCALHALAEEEEQDRGEQDYSVWTSRARKAIEHGADPRGAEFEMNNAPLHWCAWRAAPGCARALLDAGADPKAFNRAGERPEDLCRRLLQTEASGGSRPRRLALLLNMLLAAHESDELARACHAGADPEGSERGRL